MPFEKSQVHPDVAALLAVRAYIATHGFCCEPSTGTGARCFYFATWDALAGVLYWDDKDRIADLIRAELVRQFGEARPGDYDSVVAGPHVFTVPYLRRNVATTARALAVIDALVARIGAEPC